MKIGLRILVNNVVVFGTDDLGSPLPPDIGVAGYHRLLGIVRQRRDASGHRSATPEGKLLRMVEAAEEDPQAVLPAGFFVVEISDPSGDAGLHLHDEHGIHLVGPVDNVDEIVTSSARQFR